MVTVQSLGVVCRDKPFILFSDIANNNFWTFEKFWHSWPIHFLCPVIEITPVQLNSVPAEILPVKEELRIARRYSSDDVLLL